MAKWGKGTQGQVIHTRNHGGKPMAGSYKTLEELGQRRYAWECHRITLRVQTMFKNLWAPWRMKYIAELNNPGNCFLCGYIKTPAEDSDNLVLWRSESTLACMNRFPYTNGHLLIAPNAHKSDLTELSKAEMLELMQMLTKGQQALQQAFNPQGFNVGINLGRCAGAGLPGHLHFHIVPRWEGDINFMTITGQTRVIPQDIKESYQTIKAAADL
jgi:ATP adenylyltransferase